MAQRDEGLPFLYLGAFRVARGHSENLTNNVCTCKRRQGALRESFCTESQKFVVKFDEMREKCADRLKSRNTRVRRQIVRTIRIGITTYVTVDGVFV